MGSGRSFYERRKAGREKRYATKRKNKDTEDKILPSRAHKHVIREYKDESPWRTRASHPGGQGRVTREDKGESPWRTRASHPGGQGRVTREDKGESPRRTRTSHPGGQGRVTREDKSESPGRTRASHPGEQGRVTEGDRGESPRVTRTSHPGGQGRVTREDKDESSGRTESDVKTEGIKRADVSLSPASGKQADKHVFCIKHHLFELYEVIHTDVCLPEVNGTWHGGNIYLGKSVSLPCYPKIQ